MSRGGTNGLGNVLSKTALTVENTRGNMNNRRIVNIPNSVDSPMTTVSATNCLQPQAAIVPTTNNTLLTDHHMSPAHSLLQSTVPNDLASLFECPVCFDYALPPITQCSSGHIVCSMCRLKLTSCPSCRGPIGDIRNLAMDKVAQNIQFPCRYQSAGCTEYFYYQDKPEHEEICEFRPYSCPCPGASCRWQGSLEQVMPHLRHAHTSITTLQGEDIVFLATDVTLPGAVDWVMMQSCFNEHFMLVLEKQDKSDGIHTFYAVVQLIGTRKQAESFAYKLELNGPRRRLTWEATPRSIHDGIATAIEQSDCLVFDTNIALLFSENGNLGINVTISACNQQ